MRFVLFLGHAASSRLPPISNQPGPSGDFTADTSFGKRPGAPISGVSSSAGVPPLGDEKKTGGVSSVGVASHPGQPASWHVVPWPLRQLNSPGRRIVAQGLVNLP